MKKVLFVTYYFPPSGGPGVQRVLKFIKYLPKFGWEPVVLTVSNGQFLGYDESLFADIPDTLKIYKSKTIEPYNLYNMITGKEKSSTVDVNTAEIDYDNLSFKAKLIEFIRSTIFIPDARVGWRFTAPKIISQIMQEQKIDVVYTSSPPYTPALIGKYIKEKYNIPWVVSFRDPWTGYKGTPKRWWLPKMIENNLERKVFSIADAVEVAWDGIIDDAVQKYPELNPDKFNVIYNGYDPEDVPASGNTKNDKFTFTYTGTLYTIQDPELLFDVVSELVNEGKVDKNKIQFKFIGRIADEIVEKINKSPIKDCIKILGYMPHNKVMEELSKTDVSLLMGINSKEKYVNVPGKTFEYIGMGKPIFLVAPEKSTLSSIISDSGLGYAIDHSDRSEMKSKYFDLYNNWLNGTPFSPDRSKLEKHSRLNGTSKLARVLDGMIGKIQS